jgi:hypothetical protein
MLLMKVKNSIVYKLNKSESLILAKYFCIILISLGLCSCKKPFTPKELVSDNNRYLVIEGVINSGNDSTFIHISRTKKVDTSSTILPELNAKVSVESDGNTNYPLMQKGEGVYFSTPLNLDGSHKYRLRIQTSDNKEYVSDFLPVKNAPPIDSIGFATESTGLQIHVNSHDATNGTRYYRWEYKEDWQFHTIYVSAYKSNYVDSLVPRKVDVYYCFANDASTSINIFSTTKLSQDIVSRAPIVFIPSSSEKIEMKYSILVKQYALTSEAYGFWENLQKNTEKNGSIFDVLPSEAESNFHCVTDPNELVVGYLSVGATTSKRIFIDKSELPASYTPQYPAVCYIDTAFTGTPKVGQPNLIPPNNPYVPLIALYLKPGNIGGAPDAYTYTTTICGDCTIRGTKTQPSFWK